jgi:hypothetical protein
MKQFSLLFTRLQPTKRFGMLLLILALGFTTVKANQIDFYTPSCITTGQTLTIGVNSSFTYTGSWFHAQYRVNVPGAAPGPWIFLNGSGLGSTVNNTINGNTFAVTNANINIPANDYDYSLSIANVTTALNDVEFRVLIGVYGDPQVVLTPVWNGDDQNLNQTKTVRVRIRPAGDNCFTGCSDNILATSLPTTLNSPVETFYGGFEAGAANFGGAAANGSSSTAQTDLAIWTSGVPNPNSVGVTNNPFEVIWLATRYAPHSSKNLLAVHKIANGNRAWYKKLVAPSAPAQQFYGGQLTFSVWASKTGPDTDAPCFALELKGTNAANVTSTITTVPVTMTTTAGQPGFSQGDWVKYTLSIFVPIGTYKELEASIRGNCAIATNFAIDDICLVAPTAAVLPVTLSSFTGAHIDGVSNLLWTTETESNSDYFEVLYSNDGVNFKTAGIVNAAGNSARQTRYTFNDNKAINGAIYYRLKMYDKDGRFILSNPLVLKGGIKNLLVTRVFPTPFVDNINLSIASGAKAVATIRILDNTGRVIKNQSNGVNRGVTLVTVNNLSTLSRGIYILEVKAGDEVFTQKLIK